MGLRIADDQCTAAIVTDGDEPPQFIVRESVLHMSEDGDAELGGTAPERSHSITGFVGAIGDPAGIRVDDGEAYRAEDLVATALFCLINLTAEHLNGAAEFYATHGADWPQEYVQALREALDYLGLRSVALISEGELPGTETEVAGTSFAYDAGMVALNSVLATPAGATPPDPTDTENSADVTDVIPSVPEPTPQAYSAAFPSARPHLAPESAAPETAIAHPVTPQKVAPTRDSDKDRKRIPLLVAAAAVVGLALGAIVVGLLFRGNEQTSVPPIQDAQSEPSSVTPTPTTPVELPPVAPIEVTTTEPEETTTEPPETTTEEPTPSSEPPPSTTTAPRPTSTTRVRPTTTNPWGYQPLPEIPSIPTLQYPGR
ncbi:hypothetical protein GCM10023318_09260 [Nocardia callitridis]|uniref:Uncharacterized protein n=1 Tax=Nocardia callitridis TaxID=648753 RepID=A0ABP9JUT2_9NOCA